MEARAWKEETLAATVEYIKESAYEIKVIQHLRICQECQMEVCLSIERYGGRCLPWFLDLTNGDIADAEDGGYFANSDCPPVRNYKIGSYWDRTLDSKETLRFIMDRIAWAERIIRLQIVQATQFYKRLKAWDLTGLAPSEESLPF